MSDSGRDGGSSLEEVENDYWGEPPPDVTRLVTTAYRLRRKPLAELTVEDVRLLVAQQIGLEALVPRALAWLENDPLLEGDFYPGDLLVAVLRVPTVYWSAHPDQAATLQDIAASVQGVDTALQAHLDAFASRDPA